MIRRGVAVIFWAMAASICFGAILGATDTESRLISVYDQGADYSFLTKETTIGAALREAGITLDDGGFWIVGDSAILPL